jgi:hypothetical protein
MGSLEGKIDLKDEKCLVCQEGIYVEKSLYSDWEGYQECSECDHKVTRWSTPEEIQNYKNAR